MPAIINIDFGVPTQVEECFINPKNWPFPCHDKFPQFKYVQISGTSGATGTISLGFVGFF